MEGFNWMPLISIGSLILFAIGMVILLASKHHFWEGIGGVLVLLGGMGLGVTAIAVMPGWYKTLSRYHLPDRVPSTNQIVWELSADGPTTVTFPPTSEVGAEWVIITDVNDSDTAGKGEYVNGTTYVSQKPLKWVKVYLHYQDGETSVAKDVLAKAPSGP